MGEAQQSLNGMGRDRSCLEFLLFNLLYDCFTIMGSPFSIGLVKYISVCVKNPDRETNGICVSLPGNQLVDFRNGKEIMCNTHMLGYKCRLNWG